MSYRLIAIAAAAIALQGCAAKGPSATTASAESLNEGIAKSCTASPVDFAAGTTATATIAMTNDGWCAVRTVERDGQPFQLGLVRQRPEHGRVLIEKAGGQTRIEYTADGRYTGADRFSVALRSRTAGAADSVLQVAVTVSMGEGMLAPAPAPRAAPATTPRTPARTAARPRTPAR